MNPARHDARNGLWVAVGSFVIWGMMPLYRHFLNVAPSLQIVAHRVVWSTLLVVGWLLIGSNWALYI